MRLVLTRALPTLAIACATMVATAADRPTIGPVPDWVQPAQASAAAAPATAAAIQVLLNDQQVRFAPDAVETYTENRIRIQTSQGLQAVGTITLAWQPDADVITVHHLLVRRGAETRDLLGKGQEFTVLRREDMLEQATLTGMLTAVLQPADLQVGDIIEFAYTRRHADPVVPDKPDLQFGWVNAPVQSVRFRAQWPTQMHIRWQLRDFQPTLQESTAGATQSIAFSLDNPAPLLQPTGAPARYVALRRAQLTAFQSWPEVSQRFAPLYAQATKLAADSPLRGEVERIRAASADPKARATAALRLVQQQVRYVLLAMNDGALVPATADQTWQRRYGDCKAKTALLLALLQQLGIEAEPVTVNTALGEDVDRMLPGIGDFDHVLVRARISGKTYWLDGTRPADRNLDLLQVPAFGWGLPLTAKGSELVHLQPAPLMQPELVQQITVDATGGVDAPAPTQARAVFRGDGALATKLALDNLDPAQREQAMRKFWRDNYDGLEATTVSSAFDEDTGTLTWTAAGTLKMEWDDNDYYEFDKMRLGFKPDFTRPAGTDADAPYAVTYPAYTEYHAIVKLPPGDAGFTTYGNDIDQSIAGRQYKRTASIHDARLVADASFRTLVPEISAQQAHAAESGLRELSKNGLFIHRPQPIPSAAQLQSQAGTPLSTAGEYVDRGYYMMRRSMTAASIAEFDAAIKLDPDLAMAWADRGMSYFNLQQFEKARADFTKARSLDARNAIALRGLGALAVQDRHGKEAIDLLSRSLEIEESSFAHDRRASAYALENDVQHATADLIAEYQSDPTQISRFQELADMLVNRNHIDEARSEARAVIDGRIGPGNGAVIAARIYYVVGDDKEAREVLERAASTNPDPEIYVALASLDPSRAAEPLEKALQLDPDSLPAMKMLALVRGMHGDFPAAMKLLDRIDAISGPSQESSQLRALLLFRQGDAEQARKSLAASRALATTAAQLSSLCMAEVQMDSGSEQALGDCQSAVAADAKCASCMDGTGLVLLRLERFADAAEMYDKALQLEPRRAASLYARGVARLRLGQTAAGESDMSAALAIDPAIGKRLAAYGIKR